MTTTSLRSVDIGERYLITWRNGQQHVGEIVEIRVKKAKSRDSKTNLNDFSLEELEFYVHYPNFDRRLDEWIGSDRINFQTAVVVSNDTSSTEYNRKHKNKRKFEEIASNGKEDVQEKEVILQNLEKENDEITKVKNIMCVVLGKYEIDTWYFSPFPEEFSGEEKIYICEFCLKYMKKLKTLVNHCTKCHLKSPPGKQIYNDGELSMYEIDGKDDKLYCQNLCLLSKLFLDHKTLYYDVDPFLFYVLCEIDGNGYHHIVGYFSKEKHSQDNYNLACILTFPPYQRKGYGKFLISISYELSKREGVVGSPEKPLSDLGRISYRSYWAYVILSLFQKKDFLQSITVEKISKTTGIRHEDILSTLHSLNMIKYWKGQHVICVNKSVIDHFIDETSRKIKICKVNCLSWQPVERPKLISK